jgi:hypothetical protein
VIGGTSFYESGRAQPHSMTLSRYRWLCRYSSVSTQTRFGQHALTVAATTDWLECAKKSVRLRPVWHGESYLPGTVLDKMTERERQAQFLESLLKDGTGEAQRLKERILQAQRDEHCIRRALVLMVLVGIFSIVGLGYSAVLLPHFFDNATPLLVKIFCALGLGSLICMLIFGACWMWYRKASNEINESCRDYIVHELKDRELRPDFSNSVTVNKSASEVYQIETTDGGGGEPRIIQFPRAS